ncbi:uncharacterized protein LOC142181027 [Nicotiana tabacum]|uniref:Uncharacterized protein LOC142181027 n=1 Tax=Nicotiana tabacum TaxID=4097 RepID=A0AC58UIB5_TOBAC
MVLHFYGGAALPKSITHTNLVLLPKKPIVETFSDLRPISLRNFINKVLSTVLHDRLEIFLPSLISPNQPGFVKGRSIFENILLTQEIITNIRLRGKPANVVIKFDMAKAYDMVSWKYLLHVLGKIGFSEQFINMVWNLVSNNWYSVLVNGQSSGFFKSTKGVKSFMGFGMPKWSDPLNHLAYADDTIIFASAHPPSLSKIMVVLGNYEKISGQMINKDKSSYYMYSKIPNGLCQAVGAIIGFARDFPINKDLQDVAELRQGETWDDQLLDQTFNEEIVEHIRLNVHYEGSEGYWDRPYWMPTPSGKFTISSAWKILRHRADPNQEFKLKWIKGLPFKISFFLWRLWRKKIATDDMWRRQGQMVIRHWWYAQCCPKLKPLFQAVRAIITWELWKRRNAGKHGGSVSTNRMIHEINRTFHQLARVRVTWQLPFHGWYKCNTDGSSKGNPGPSSLGFCVRNDEGDVVYARAVGLGVTTNVVAEAKSILQGLEYYVEHDLHPLILETDSLVHLDFTHSLNYLVQGGVVLAWSNAQFGSALIVYRTNVISSGISMSSCSI